MVVGMNHAVIAFRTSEDFNGAVGDDFVGVHMAVVPAPPDGITDKLIVELTGHNLIAGLADGVADGLVNSPTARLFNAEAF